MSFNIVGYIHRWNLRPGEISPVSVSSKFPEFFAKLYRLTGAVREDGDWARKLVHVASNIEGSWRGVDAPYRPGSFLRLPTTSQRKQSFALSLRIWFREILPAEATLAEFIFGNGSIRISLENGESLHVGASGAPRQTLPCIIQARRWYDVAITVPGSGGGICVHLTDLSTDEAARLDTSTGAAADLGPLRETLLGGRTLDDGAAQGHLDAKIENPGFWIDVAPQSRTRFDPAGALAAGYWDLSDWTQANRVRDAKGRSGDALVINAPTFAVTSSAWRGQAICHADCPEAYSAVALHTDDMEDAGWPEPFSLEVDAGLRSGAYCIVLSERAQVEFDRPETFFPIPVFVGPRPGAGGDAALVLPTFSYRSYVNNWFYGEADPRVFVQKGPTRSAAVYDYCVQNRLMSLYGTHPDGHGVHLSTLKRPLVTVRPDFVSQLLSHAHQFSADLEILEWLEDEGVNYDILTDEMIHAEGAAILSSYKAVLSGTHPEYSSNELLNGFCDYQAAGGSLMYMGGNGFFWRVTIDPQRPWLLELRRGDDAAIWASEPGECHHQTDGKRGGIWRDLGRPPNLTFGIGFAAIGFGGPGHFVVPEGCELDGLPPRTADVIRNIGGKPFGLCGLELDSYDTLAGSSTTATVFGAVDTLPPGYIPYGPYLGELGIDPVDAIESNIRANMIWAPNAGKGGTFTAGSILWSSGLNERDDPWQVRALTTAMLRDLLEMGA